ncbi:translation initiation factor eIF-2B subunit delta [Nannizzia gypsea CBS 118893]|uniref:Translation initiation factor eIF2B subunit delta n=1 Tax=Arthroderma gypseum (strain ATCC MYA-4604 / CBS 118893) TaxID=535722 RepID=E4V3S9_ARTGP|nr:translation initiation factor eIF-2B subunit delta [Nannizzia gypsea CBS 118893]EFR04653.1 translation initiation factor eIF-2B subunit delta [Nannizzia gypsea CBS 118893]
MTQLPPPALNSHTTTTATAFTTTGEESTATASDCSSDRLANWISDIATTMATPQDQASAPAPPAAATQPSAQSTPPIDTAPAKAPKPDSTQKQAKEKPAASGGAEKLSGAELKKRAKAEKAARRAKEKQDRRPASEDQEADAATYAASTGSAVSSATSTPQGPSTPKKAASVKSDASKSSNKSSAQRHGPAHTLPTPPAPVESTSSKKKRREVVDEKVVAVFGHLPWYTRRTGIAGANKDVHPAVLTLGMQIKDYVVCGSSARCVATLLAFKRVVQSYITPPGTSLARHLTTHLGHQIAFLASCRPLAISQGNAIRALKLIVSSIDPSVPEPDAKQEIYDFIDNFIREKITVAGQVIANSAAQKIDDGDVILCFSGSSVIQRTLLTAHKQGKKFRVSIIDTRPLFEGRNLAQTLAKAGLRVQYSLINGISQAVKDATKVFLGAHAMTSNGGLFSRVGTALVAMSAKEKSGGMNIPVIVCCETIKFTDRVALDSIVVNEIAEADELVAAEPCTQLTDLPPPVTNIKPETSKGSSSSAIEIPAHLKNPKLPLENWREMPNLQLLNIMHDLTPAEYVDMVVTEMGSLPPSAVPVVHRMSTETQN